MTDDDLIFHDPTQTCITCRFSDDKLPLCRLHPPVRLPRRFVGDGTRTRREEIEWGWPEVEDDDWCGEWKEHPMIAQKRAVEK